MAWFGELDVVLDAWEAGYGPGLPLELDDDGSGAEVILDVEVEGPWAPVVPSAPAAVPPLVFADGVRRIDRHVVATARDGRRGHGAFASVAAGSVVLDGRLAAFGQAVVRRLLILGAGLAAPEPLEVGPGLTYSWHSTEANEAGTVFQEVQTAMRRTEAELAESLSRAGGEAVLLVDGPLFDAPSPGLAVGYVKRIFRPYLPASHLGLLARLPPGSRTPLFGIAGGRPRYAWYLRLAAPAPGESELAGVVRLEVAQTVGRERARWLADLTAAQLPALAPRHGRDPRAPQNLLPIGALEGRLKRRLGDARLVERKIRALVARQESHGQA